MKRGNYDGNRQAAIVALLSEQTLEAAAQSIGVDPTTLYRWLKEPEFISEYRAARREAVTQAVARLQADLGESVKVLQEIIRNPQASAMARVKAIGLHLEYALRAVELDDLQARIEALEAAQSKPKQGEWLRVGESDENEPNERQGAAEYA